MTDAILDSFILNGMNHARGMVMKTLLLAAALLSPSGLVHAGTPPPATLCADPAYHGWDFWLGRWQVTDPQGVLQGTNEITRGPGGCGLLEHWRSQQGGEGLSVNGYDPFTGEWTQTWLSGSESISLKGKIDKDGALRTSGTITSFGARESQPFRGNWIPLPDGSVRQEFFIQNPKTKEWSSWFVGHYSKAP